MQSPLLPGLATAMAFTAASAQTQVTPDIDADRNGAPRWEAGLAAGGGRVADYPGADQAHTRGIVLPVFIYRGPVLRVDPGGIRGRFVHTPQWELDLSASAAFNARNNDARQGMRPLDYLFGVGPQWVYKGWQSASGGPTLHLKLRALMSTDFRHFDPRGVSVDPELRWRLGRSAGAQPALTLSLQPSWASRPLQRYFYEVSASEATPSRPAYAARAGYLGTEAAVTWSGRRSASLSGFVTARAMSLHGAANAASPLLRDRSNVGVGAGIVWTPWHSSERVAD